MSVKNILRSCKIIPRKGALSKSAKVFSNAIPDFREESYDKASDYISSCLGKCKEQDDYSESLHGKIFELIIATLLYREELFPFYREASVVFVPNCKFDLLFYSESKGPITISLKTSLRERYKQADLEATSIKFVHRKAQNFLVTLSSAEAKKVRQKIIKNEVLGLDGIYVATELEMNDLVCSLKRHTFKDPGNVEVIPEGIMVDGDEI